MPLARIIASDPSAAKDTARAFRQSGYDVEIVAPGSVHRTQADVEFNADTDTVMTQTEDHFVAGQREFILLPVWRRLTARFHAARDVARAKNAAQSSREEHIASPDDLLIEPQRQEARHREQQEAQRHAEFHAQEVRRQETMRQEREQREQEADRQREIALQRENEQHEIARRESLARQREMERRELAQRQEQEARRQRVEELRQEQESLRRQQLQREQAALQRQEELRREREESRRQEVLRRRQAEDEVRRAEAQRLVLEASQRAVSEEELSSQEEMAPPAVMTFREFLGHRRQAWRDSRQTREQAADSARTGIIWKRAWPVAAAVAAAFAIGWGISSYENRSVAPAAQSAPPTLAPGQFAPYPVAKPRPAKPAANVTPARRHTRTPDIADDEVTVRRYYPAKGVTAQNAPQHPKKITDL